jgi:nucleoid DNA-binding protein
MQSKQKKALLKDLMESFVREQFGLPEEQPLTPLEKKIVQAQENVQRRIFEHMIEKLKDGTWEHVMISKVGTFKLSEGKSKQGRVRLRLLPTKNTVVTIANKDKKSIE